MNEPIRLTQYSHGAGCGCKISPQVLEVILAGSGAQNLDPNLWVGKASRDDAAVYAIDDERGDGFTIDRAGDVEQGEVSVVDRRDIPPDQIDSFARALLAHTPLPRP